MVNQTGRLDTTFFVTVLGREDDVEDEVRHVETETAGEPLRELFAVMTYHPTRRTERVSIVST